MEDIYIAASSSNGLSIIQMKDKLEVLQRFSQEQVKAFAYSTDGQFFGISYDKKLEFYETIGLKKIHSYPYENISKMVFSPLNTTVVIFEHFREGPNLRFIDFKTGAIMKEVTQRDSGLWRPQWSADEKVAVRFSQGTILVHTNNDFTKTSDQPTVKNVHSISLNDSGWTPRLAICSLGKGNDPSYVKIHSLEDGKLGSMLVNKTFFGSDEVGFTWSPTGNDLLVLATKTNSTESYYGVQNLYFMTTSRGGESCIVKPPKEGQIHDIKWVPKNALTDDPKAKTPTLFALCYGSMPSKVSIYGTDCEIKYHIGGGGSFNFMSFNRPGNLIMLAGSGNVRGNVSVWDFKNKQRLSARKCPDMTAFSWLDDGQHFIASTTTPKLRVNNGFTVYRYDGEEIHRWDVEERAVIKKATFDLPEQRFHELYHVLSRPLPKDYPVSKFKAVKGIIEAESLGNKKADELAKASAYIPPSLRKNDGTRKDDGLAENIKKLNVNKQQGKKPNAQKKNPANPNAQKKNPANPNAKKPNPNAKKN